MSNRNWSKEQLEAVAAKPGYGVDSAPGALVIPGGLPHGARKGPIMMTHSHEAQAKSPIRQSRRGMNKWEREWGTIMRIHGGFERVMYQPFKLQLGNGVTYTPDWVGWKMVPSELSKHATHIEFHEVKGYARDDAIVKLKVAATMFPMFKFVLVTRAKGQWKEHEVLP